MPAERSQPSEITTQAAQRINDLIRHEALPPSYQANIETYLVPLASRVAAWQQALDRPLILGLNGAQGTGKSTVALFLQSLLNEAHDCPCARFSLDDIYLTRAEREGLAASIHPLLLTRGVPGTHDLLLGQQVIDGLLVDDPSHETPIPAFDKAIDDRLPKHEWPVFKGQAQVVLIEGWCLGAKPEHDPERLAKPVNKLEKYEDQDGLWRQYVNDQLWGPYAWFVDQIDRLIMLKAPSMESVVRWRTLQEQKLAQKVGNAPEEGGKPARKVMGASDLARFIMHYERITRRCLAEMPARADVVLEIDQDHQIKAQRLHNQLEGDWLR